MVAALEAILIDDDRDEAKAFRTIWEKILGEVWPNVNLQVQEDFDDTSIFEARRPHIAIIDNVLQTESGEIDNRGLDLISQLKPMHEDTLFILFTRKTFTIDSLGYRFPNPDLIVTKTPLPNQRYESDIAKQISERISRLPVEQVWFSRPSEINESDIGRLEVQSLIEQCVLSFQSFRKEFGQTFEPVEQANLSRLGGGRSGASVFKCELFRGGSTANTQFVFKYSDLRSIGREIDNYHKFVRLQIPHHVRVDLVGVGRTGEFGAALYGFAFGNSEIVSALTEPLRNGSLTELFDFVDSVIGREAIGWYQFTNVSVQLEEYFNNGLEYSPDKDSRRLSGIRNNVSSFFSDSEPKISDSNIEFEGLSLKHVRAYMQVFRGENLPLFICHGDLNSNNVMVFEGKQQFSLIDFEYTENDSVYKDFVSLETSLRLNFPLVTEIGDLKFWLTAERDMLTENARSGQSKASFRDLPDQHRALFEAVVQLRQRMVSFLQSRDITVNVLHYECALSFHLFKLCGLDGWSKSEFTRLWFSYLAALSALEASQESH